MKNRDFAKHAQEFLESNLNKNPLDVFKSVFQKTNHNTYCLIKFIYLDRFNSRVFKNIISGDKNCVVAAKEVELANKIEKLLLPDDFDKRLENLFITLRYQDDPKSKILFQYSLVEAFDFLFSKYEMLQFVQS